MVRGSVNSGRDQQDRPEEQAHRPRGASCPPDRAIGHISSDHVDRLFLAFLEHLGQRNPPAPPRQRFPLRRRRCPAGHHRQPQRGAAAAVLLRQPGQCLCEQRAWRRAAVALGHGVALAGGAQVAQQRQRIGVEQGDVLGVDHRQREAGALQQRGAVAQVGEWRDARRGAAG
jgi:hypothetical protein